MTNNLTVDLTDKQLERQARNEDIVRRYKELRKHNPDVSNERIFSTIAKDYPICAVTVRLICERAGLCVKADDDVDR